MAPASLSLFQTFPTSGTLLLISPESLNWHHLDGSWLSNPILGYWSSVVHSFSLLTQWPRCSHSLVPTHVHHQSAYSSSHLDVRCYRSWLSTLGAHSDGVGCSSDPLTYSRPWKNARGLWPPATTTQVPESPFLCDTFFTQSSVQTPSWLPTTLPSQSQPRLSSLSHNFSLTLKGQAAFNLSLLRCITVDKKANPATGFHLRKCECHYEQKNIPESVLL